MKAGAQQIIRIEVDEQTLETLQENGGTIHFPLNEENTKLIEIERVDAETTEETSENPRGVQ